MGANKKEHWCYFHFIYYGKKIVDLSYKVNDLEPNKLGGKGEGFVIDLCPTNCFPILPDQHLLMNWLGAHEISGPLQYIEG